MGGVARNPIRVVIADNSQVIRDALMTMVADHRNLQVTAVCSTGRELRRVLSVEHPDVVVTDIRISSAHGDEGIRIARRLRVTNAEIGVIVLSQYAEPAHALALLNSGTARAYLLKERVRGKGELASVIEAVARGHSSIDPELVAALIEARSRAAHSPLTRLAPPACDLLASVAEGKSATTIAYTLGSSREQVEEEIEWIFRTLGLPPSDDGCTRAQTALAFLAQDGG